MSGVPADPERHGRAVLRRRYASAEEAEAISKTLEPDNAAYLLSRTEGAELILEVTSRQARELRSTLDDALACLSAAEKTRGAAVAGPAPHPTAAKSPDENRDA